MSNWVIYFLGFTAQLLFSSRLIIQWFLSEKKKEVVTPALFWVLSLLASFLMFIYGYLRNDFAIMFGQTLTYFIYIRNLQLQKHWKKIPILLRWFFLVLPFVLLTYYFNNNIIDLNNLLKNKSIPLCLLLLGIFAQMVFTFRFIYQWIYSEKQKKSFLPLGFWVLSNVGAVLILIYAIIRKDPVLLVGHTMGVFIYTRNIFLSKKPV